MDNEVKDWCIEKENEMINMVVIVCPIWEI